MEQLQKAYEEAQVKEQRTLAGQLLRFAEKHARDALAVDALVHVVEHIEDPESRRQAIRMLSRRHSRSDRIGAVCAALVSIDEEGAEKLLRQILAENPHRAVRGRACLSLGQRCQNRAESAGKPEEEAKQIREAEKHFKQVVEKYADLRDGDRNTLGAVATEELKKLAILTSLAVGKTAPEAQGTVDGKPFKLSDHRGKVVVLKFGATWCGPCRAMKPHQELLRKRLTGKLFSLLDVDIDANAELATKWNIRSIPAVFVLDHRGVIRYKGCRGKDLDAAVDALLKEMEDKTPRK
jgi:thiol-disulfide isomerase/thioredoxin